MKLKYEMISWLTDWVSSRCPGWFVDFCAFLRIKYKKIMMPERKRSFGVENSDKVFFVIRIYPPGSGLLALYMYVLGYMEYAEQNGWIPVVDMQNYATHYDEKDSINGTQNTWEYFFTQPTINGMSYSLDEVYKSENVILSDGTMDEWYNASLSKEALSWQMKQGNRVFFQREVLDYLERIYHEVVPDGVRVIGTIVRGRNRRFRLHGNDIQISVEELVPILKEKMIEWECDYVFVKAEEEESLDYIRSRIPSVICTNASRISGFKQHFMGYSDTNYSDSLENNSKYRNTVEYLAEIYILSKCTCLIGSKNNGLLGAVIWNNSEYEHFELIDKGVYK